MPIAIAGMHRSGTSMVARLLNLCGVYLGDKEDLTFVAKDNSAGFWEHARFQALNEEILASFNGSWDMPPSPPSGWEDSLHLIPITRNAKLVIKEMLQYPVWGWKDPRNSLTIAFWKKIIPNLKIVICLRNPIDVYHSLAHRGYASSKFSYHLWMMYYQHLLAATEPEERIITHYDSFFRFPKSELRRLTDFLELDISDQTISYAGQTILADQRHHHANIFELYETNASEELIDLYRELCVQAGDAYRVSLFQEEKEFLEDRTIIEEPTMKSVEFSQSLKIAYRERMHLRNEVIKLREEKALEIARLQSEMMLAIEKLQGERSSEVTKLQDEKAREAAKLQHEITAYQGILHRIYSSRTWRFLQILQKIRLFFVPIGSQREKYFIVLSRILSLRYVKGLISALREKKKDRFEGQVRQNDGDVSAQASVTDAVTSQIYSDLLISAKNQSGDEYVTLSEETLCENESPLKLLAFYMPQFHPITENDEWWGKGFVEWTNVAKSIPQFVGHYQPHLPGELGFYDLRIPEIQKRQIELARKYGVSGFVFHYYWFNGRRLLEKPLDLFLNSTEDFPFCICWANENWTRRWDGREHEVLIAQEHSPESDLRFIEDLGPILKDQRYIRIHGRPLVIVYRTDIIPRVKQTVEIWREYCTRYKIGDPYLVAAQTFEFGDPRLIGFDAAVEFPPHNVPVTDIRDRLQISNPQYTGQIFDYQDIIKKISVLPKPDYKLFKTVFPGWDNEARQPANGYTFAFSTPDLYKQWLLRAAEITLQELDPEKRLLFINAWNEWGEGAHLEPDRKYGYAYLQATMDALKEITVEQDKKINISNPASQYIS